METMSARSATLDSAVAFLANRGIRFHLVHESALMAWGVDNNIVLEAVDVHIPDTKDIEDLGLDAPDTVGSYVETVIDDVRIRVWSSAALGLPPAYIRVFSKAYACWCLDPAIVLELLPLSPDALWLHEQRARLAEILFFDRMDDDLLERYMARVRG